MTIVPASVSQRVYWLFGPARTDLIERFKDSNLPIYTIEELQQLAFDLVGKPQDIPVSDKDEDIVAIVEYRDGSIIDVVRKPL